MSLYPKQPFGPSAAGTAGVRALDSVGGAWQRKNGAGFVAQRKGDFSRVTTNGFEYLTEGRLDNLPAKTVQLAALFYRVPFLPGFGRPMDVNVGRGTYFGTFGYYPGPSSQQVTYDYPAPAPFADRAIFARYSRVAESYFGSFYGASNFRGGVPYSQTRMQFSDETISLGPSPAFLGNTPSGRVSVFATTVLNGRIDVAGRELEDPALCVIPESEPGTINPLNVTAFTRPRAEFFPSMPCIATKDHLGVFMLEKFFYTEAAANNAGKQPKFWLLRAVGKDVSALSISDLTNALFSGAFVPRPYIDGVTDRYNSNIGIYENARFADTMAFMRVVALPDNTVLLAYFIYAGGLAYDGLGFPTDTHYRLRIARVTLGPAVTASVVFERTVGFSPNFPGPQLPAQRVQDIVYLGAGRVLARNVYGLGQPNLYNGMPPDAPMTGGDWSVKFLRSPDAGLTWTEYEPTGFDASLQNKHFGHFVVHRPRTSDSGDSDGVVLCSSWDATRLAYFVYESKDDGVTWARTGQIIKPKSFQRMDQDYAFDTGGNFQMLLPGPDPTRPADITIPDRFNP